MSCPGRPIRHWLAAMSPATIDDMESPGPQRRGRSAQRTQRARPARRYRRSSWTSAGPERGYRARIICPIFLIFLSGPVHDALTSGWSTAQTGRGASPGWRCSPPASSPWSSEHARSCTPTGRRAIARSPPCDRRGAGPGARHWLAGPRCRSTRQPDAVQLRPAPTGCRRR